jgi:hypothetical protein
MTRRKSTSLLYTTAGVRLVAALSLAPALSLGCGDDDEGGGEGGGAMWSADSCQWMEAEPQGAGNCSAMELRAHTDCVVEACQGATAACFGDDYLRSRFEGPCAPFGECAVACRCNDTACLSRCSYTDTCLSCLNEQRSCSTACGVPQCARDALAAAGVDTNFTCADLRECCFRTVPSFHMSCLSAVDMIMQTAGGSADFLCAGYSQLFCETYRQR